MIDFAQKTTAAQRDAAALIAARNAAYVAICTWVDDVAASITGPIPADVKLSWAPKEAAARAVIEGVASGPERRLLAIEAAVLGVEAADLAPRIVEKADRYRAAIAWLEGVRGDAFARIEAAADVAAVEAVLTEVQARPLDGYAD